jgi:hypothetical protein
VKQQSNRAGARLASSKGKGPRGCGRGLSQDDLGQRRVNRRAAIGGPSPARGSLLGAAGHRLSRPWRLAPLRDDGAQRDIEHQGPSLCALWVEIHEVEDGARHCGGDGESGLAGHRHSDGEVARPSPFREGGGQRGESWSISAAESSWIVDNATSGAVCGKDKDSRPPDSQGLIFGKIGSSNDQSGPVARSHKDQVSLVSAHVPGAITGVQAATHCETHPPAERAPPAPKRTNHEAETHKDH